MGFLTDIRSGKRDRYGLGAYVIIFWLCTGCVAAGGLVAGGSEKQTLAFVIAGAMFGACIGFYATFGTTLAARVLAWPGIVVAAMGILVGF